VQFGRHPPPRTGRRSLAQFGRHSLVQYRPLNDTALGAVLTGPRLATLGRATATESEPLSPAFRHQLQTPILWASTQTRLAIGIGIIFLMAVKPATGGALLTIEVAVLLGVASALPAWGRDRTPAPTG